MIELLVRKEKLKSGSTAFVLEPSSFSIGALGANIVDEIHLVVPDEWIESKIAITFSPQENKKVFVPVNKEMIAKVTADISTVDGLGTIVVTAEKENGYVAFSTGARYTAYFHPDAIVKIPDSNPIKEMCRNELADSLEKATGEEQSNKSWEELTDDVSKLIIVDEEKQEKLDGFDMVRYSVENADIGRTGNYAIATQGLFTTAPVNESGFNVEFSLPYFNTSKAKWEYVEGTNSVRRDYFSPYLKEIGLDCTSAVNFATYRCKASIFEYMEKLKLTNVSCPLDGAFKRCANLNVLEIYGTDGVLKPKELTHTFYECNELIEINGDELDLSDLTSATLAFYGCYILQYIRFKPFTLKVSLDLGDCRYINIKAHSFPSVMDFGTLISLLNAIPEPEGNDNSDITITLNKGIEESLSMAYVIKDEETHLYKYNPEPEVITSWGFLYDAFLMKGVTLAWKN